MYRYVEIDLTRGADDVCSSYTIGRDGENLATALKVILPDKFVNSNIIFEFKMSDGSAFSSKMIPFNEEIVYEIQDFLMIEGLMTISIVAIDSTTGAVVKPFQKNFIVSSSTGILPSQGIPYGVADDHEKRIEYLESSSEEMQKISHEHSNKDVLERLTRSDLENISLNTNTRHKHDNSETLNLVTETMLDDIEKSTESRHNHSNKDVIDSISANILNDILENTAARHSHENADTLGKLGDSEGKLTYDGRAVGERATKTVTFTSLCNDFYYTSPVTRCFLIDVLAKDGLTSGTEIKSILIKGENGFIDIKDLSIKENEGKPCIFSYLHADLDNRRTLIDDDGNFQQGVNIASIYFPASGNAYSNFSIQKYSEIKVEFYEEVIS